MPAVVAPRPGKAVLKEAAFEVIAKGLADTGHWHVSERHVFYIGCNNYRLVRAITIQAGLVWVKTVLTHRFKTKKEAEASFF